MKDQYNDLIIDNFIIGGTALEILTRLKEDPFNFGYLKAINDKQEYVQITCPFHKDGRESRPSASVYALNGQKVPFGHMNCFTCHESVSLPAVVQQVLQCNRAEANHWLIENFAIASIEERELPEFTRKEAPTVIQQTILDPSVLGKYETWHPYMEQRKITPEIAQLFHVGYDSAKQCITFPVWDSHNNLVMVTERSINSKKFYIPTEAIKPVYLLNYILNWKISSVVVVESQINALTLWSWHIPAIALFGTGSEYQYELLKQSGIRRYYLAFDGDQAGYKGSERFRKALGKYALIDKVVIPAGKDVNDLTELEYRNLPTFAV